MNPFLYYFDVFALAEVEQWVCSLPTTPVLLLSSTMIVKLAIVKEVSEVLMVLALAVVIRVLSIIRQGLAAALK